MGKKVQILTSKKFRRPRNGRRKRFSHYKHLAGWFIIFSVSKEVSSPEITFVDPSQEFPNQNNAKELVGGKI
jgi:hypothetical protein